MTPEDFDYTMMVNELELVNSLVKTIHIHDNGLGVKTTHEDIFHMNGVSYVDCPTDSHGPILKATILHSGDRRLHMDNFKDRIDSYCFDTFKHITKNYYSKDNGDTWKPIMKNNSIIKKSYV